MSLWYYLLLFCGSLLLTGLFRSYAIKMFLLDIPNQRSSHTMPTPRGGGMAIIVTFLAGSWLLVRFAVLPVEVFRGVGLCSSVVAGIGLWDDLRSVPAWVRLSVHLMTSFVVVLWMATAHSMPFLTGTLSWGLFGGVFAVISLAWLLNLFNFMDGIDGIAAVETMSVAASAMLLLWFAGAAIVYVYWLGVLIVAAAGFLVWNWPPARIFMGDACSGFLGFCLGIFALITSADTKMTLWAWFILLGVFIADATVTLSRRIWRKERFLEAHRSHAYQILARRLHSHKKVTLGVLAVNVLWLLPWAFFSISWPCYGLFFALIAYVPLVFFCVKVGAGTINE